MFFFIILAPGVTKKLRVRHKLCIKKQTGKIGSPNMFLHHPVTNVPFKRRDSGIMPATCVVHHILELSNKWPVQCNNYDTLHD